jgi:hypothetical protein
MRPTGLGSGFYKDNVDYGIYCGEWCIGRIYRNRNGPADLRWFWALHAPSKPGSICSSNSFARSKAIKSQQGSNLQRSGGPVGKSVRKSPD